MMLQSDSKPAVFLLPVLNNNFCITMPSYNNAMTHQCYGGTLRSSRPNKQSCEISCKSTFTNTSSAIVFIVMGVWGSSAMSFSSGDSPSFEISVVFLVGYSIAVLLCSCTIPYWWRKHVQSSLISHINPYRAPTVLEITLTFKSVIFRPEKKRKLIKKLKER